MGAIQTSGSDTRLVLSRMSVLGFPWSKRLRDTRSSRVVNPIDTLSDFLTITGGHIRSSRHWIE